MTHIVVKNYNKQGSIAYRAFADLDVALFVEGLENKYECSELQFVTTGGLDIYAEYQPIHEVYSVNEFETQIKALAEI